MIHELLFLIAASAQPQAPSISDWREMEAPLLTDHVQLTGERRFVKAGEAYFSPDARWIIFQGVPVPPEGHRPSPFYSMYVARLERDGDGRVTGIDEPIRVSPDGSANTCGWFHPKHPGRILFGSTLVPPAIDEKPGFRVGQRRYVWQFPEEMDVVEMVAGAVFEDQTERRGMDVSPPSMLTSPRPLIGRPGYDAECSYSSDGRYVLYANVDPTQEGKPDADIWLRDTYTDADVPLVQAEGYDGGPFFSPDGMWICYRSDREGDDRLQLFIAELAFDESGDPIGIEREVQVTDNAHVNWAPFWTPDGKALVYATSEVGHHNYEVFAVEVDPDARYDELRHRRVTWADGFDGLPAFSPDGSLMMWTSQRNPDGPGSGSSQLWLARVPGGATGGDFSAPLSRTQARAVAHARLGDWGLTPSSVRMTVEAPEGEDPIVTITPLRGGETRKFVIDGAGEAHEIAADF